MTGRGLLAALGMVLLVAALWLVPAGLEGDEPEPSRGLRSGAAGGLGGWTALLRHEGVDLRIATVDTEDLRLLPRTTYLFAEDDLVSAEGRGALRRVVAGIRDGARVVAVGGDAARLAGALGVRGRTRSARGSRATRATRAPETRAVGVVVDARAAWSAEGLPARAQPLLRAPAADGGVAYPVVRLRYGAGSAVLVADRDVLVNRALGRADNAALAVALAGSGRVVALRPRADGGGLGDRTQAVLLLLVLAAVAGLLARGRRLGPPVAPDADPVPRRSAYVDALAAALERTDDPTIAVAATHQHARALVRRRAGLPRGASEEELAAAARRLGLDDEEVAALAVGRPDDLVAPGRALAALESAARGPRMDPAAPAAGAPPDADPDLAPRTPGDPA